MKKILIISFSTLLLVACSEQHQYQDTVLEQISNDPDIKSYHLDPQSTTDCIVDLSSKKMPGMVPFDPMRKAAYKGYAKMISIKTSEKPEEVLAELRESFGSAQGLSDAHRNYSKSYLECITTITHRKLDVAEVTEK
ncbi:MAG: hypothetical protein HON51_03945 [Gammaproteobacteria bacterium]|jgi:hypothetical protein|nr:hypothetical protein [Gammaproteobacteria bacterium]MBT5223335.1 hypothetical protein [Gammaproteobacteria bacterium]MBT5825247.1 hypothetical protein [Gammaproteobacteria bacterium]MBT5967183.1 hypothetical protein [Gammaproteobacteria bacterium]MBT6420128.1 hypothetical protein [Gammaproteobacteria bacterium]